MNRIGFIGVGNMGRAMASAIINGYDDQIVVYDQNKAACMQFSEDDYVLVASDLEELVRQAKYIVLSVKPQYYMEVCSAIKGCLTPEHVIITVAPGYSIKKMKELLNSSSKIIRTMPNTPALIASGVTAYTYYSEELTQEEIDRFLDYFNRFGQSIYVDEKLMAAVVAASGSSPAYAYMFIEAMADAAVSFGMPRDMAYEMSALAIKGACEMILKTKRHPGELKDAVTSPGGTTIQAVMALEESGFRNSVIQGMTACYNKANQMANN